jgi:dTDP-4-dehydrorhamnose reductase
MIDNFLIVGIDSQIGKALKNKTQDKNYAVYGTTRRKCNIDIKTFYLDLENPDFKIFDLKFGIVVLCSATTNFDQCDSNFSKYHKINVENTISLIKFFSRQKSFVIYLSSNAVFDGTKQFYKSTDQTCPTTSYGKYKSEVEKYLTNHESQNSCVLRLTKVISEATPFLERWSLEALQGQKIKANKKRYLAPISMELVTSTIIDLADKKQPGLFQLGGREEISYYDYARYIYKNNPNVLKLIEEDLDENEMYKVTYNSLETYLP